MRSLQVIIVSFNLHKGRLVPAGHEPAGTAKAANARAKALLGRFAGVGVYGVWVDETTLDASDLHEIARFGEVPTLDAVEAAA